MVVMIISALMAKEISERVDIVVWPDAKGRALSTIAGCAGGIGERTRGYRQGTGVKGCISPRIASISQKQMRVYTKFVVRKDGQCKGNALPISPESHRNGKAERQQHPT